MINIMKKQAFTLIEVMIVVIIMGLIASYALPKYTSVIEKMHAKNAQQTLLDLYGAQKRYKIDNGNYASDAGAMDLLDVEPKGSDQFYEPVVCDKIVDGKTIIAEISRASTNPGYTLQININAELTCINPVPPNICTKLGL